MIQIRAPEAQINKCILYIQCKSYIAAARHCTNYEVAHIEHFRQFRVFIAHKTKATCIFVCVVLEYLQPSRVTWPSGQVAGVNEPVT